MDLKNFCKENKISQVELSKVFGCGQGNVSSIVNGKRNLTGLQIRLLIEHYGFDVVARYAEPAELPAVTVQAPVTNIADNSGQVNSGSGPQNNGGSSDPALIEVVNKLLESNAKKDQQIDRLLALLEQKQ